MKFAHQVSWIFVRTSRFRLKRSCSRVFYKDEHDLESYFEKAQPLHLYTIESIQQYEQLRSLSERYQRRTFVVLRLSSGNQFGLDEASIEQIVASRAQAPFIEIQGIQFFSGTQKRRSHLFEKEMAKLEHS